MKFPESQKISPVNQRGSVLIVSVLFLIVLTLLGVSVVRLTLSEEQVASNNSSEQLAVSAAETALRDGEKWLDQLRFYPADKRCADGDDCKEIEVLSPSDAKFDDVGDFAALDSAAWERHGRSLSTVSGEGTLTIDGVAKQPRRIVREARFMPDSMTRGITAQPGRYLYEVTGWGVGGDEKVESNVQSTFIRRY